MTRELHAPERARSSLRPDMINTFASRYGAKNVFFETLKVYVEDEEYYKIVVRIFDEEPEEGRLHTYSQRLEDEPKYRLGKCLALVDMAKQDDDITVFRYKRGETETVYVFTNAPGAAVTDNMPSLDEALTQLPYHEGAMYV